MTFDPAIPLSTDSPALFPSQSQANFAQLKKIIEADHQFNETAAANDGYHNMLHMQIPNPAPTGALASLGRLYTKTVGTAVQLFYMDSLGVEYQITPDSSNSSIVKTAGLNVTATPTIILAGNDMPKYTAILTIIEFSTNHFKTYTVFRDGVTANLSSLNSSGSGFNVTPVFDAGGGGDSLALVRGSSGTTNVRYTLNIVSWT